MASPVTVVVPPRDDCPPPAPVFIQQTVNSAAQQHSDNSQNQWQHNSIPPCYPDYSMPWNYMASPVMPPMMQQPMMSPPPMPWPGAAEQMPPLLPEVSSAVMPDFSYLNSLSASEELDAAQQVKYDHFYNEWYQGQ